MNNSEKNSYFTRVEDKYVFRISTAFWHFLIAIVTLSGIAGIGLFVWSIIPVQQKNVKMSSYPVKEKYPPVEYVYLDELNDVADKDVRTYIPPPAYNPPAESTYDEGKPAYTISFSELKRLIPPDDWQPGEWTYPQGKLAWDLHGTDEYRKWEPVGNTVEQILENSYSKISAKTYSQKKIALDAYLKVLNKIPASHRSGTLQLTYFNINSNFKDLKMLDSVFTVIAKNVNAFSMPIDGANMLITFALNNPYEAYSFIPFAVKTMNMVNTSERTKMFTALNSAFYSNFNNNVEIQKEATSQFYDLIPKLGALKPDLALSKYYTVYLNKNRDRNEKISHIESDFNNQMRFVLVDSTRRAVQAQNEYYSQQSKKKESRSKAIYAIAAGFVAIALLGTILTLLSIQRILKRMEINSAIQKSA